MEATEGVPAHERNSYSGRRAYSHCDAWDARGWDIDVLKGVELPGLLLPVDALDGKTPISIAFELPTIW